jgi:hypothetical protein
MKKIINGLVFIIGLGFSSFSLASTVNLLAYNTDVSIKVPSDLSVGINYDSTNWASINSATLSVKMRDDERRDWREWADITSINGGADPEFAHVEVGRSRWYWKIDVSSYLTLGQASILNFVLESKTKKLSRGYYTGDYLFKNARLRVDYNAIPNAVPVPAALFLFAPALLGFFGLRRKAQA